MTSPCVRLGMFNVRGLRHTAQEVQDWIEEENLNVTALSETNIKAGSSTGISLRHEQVASPRSKGGVAIVIYGMAKHKVVLRYPGESIQAIAICVKNVNYVSVYISPSTTKNELVKALDTIHYKCKGKTILMGDFNARRVEWCTRNDTRGNQLVKWATHRGWIIDAPNIPTRQETRDGKYANTGATTIDLMVTRNWKAHTFRYPREFCLGLSDHIPIQAQLDQTVERDREPPRISLHRHTRVDLQEHVIKNMEEHLPNLIEELENVHTQDELDVLYDKYIALMVDPFMPKGRNRSCRRRKYFWTKRMSCDARKRSSLWKKYMRTRAAEDYNRYKVLHMSLQRRVRRAKRKAFRELLDSIEDDWDHDTPARVSRMNKSRQRRTIRSSSYSEGGLDLESFTQYVANKFEASPIITGEHFDVDEKELEADILQAILTSGKKSRRCSTMRA